MNRSLIATFSALFSCTDEEAMCRVQQSDDPHAFAQLVSRWETPIQRLCARMLGDSHRGEDLTQDTFARLFARRKDYQPTGRFSTFLWRIALNLCYDELRRMKRRPESRLDDGLDADAPVLLDIDAAGPDTQLLRREQSDIVRSAVMQLSESYRSVIILRHFENLKFREIADVLGIPEGTVKSRMAEALTQLQRALGQSYSEKAKLLCKSHNRRMETRLAL